MNERDRLQPKLVPPRGILHRRAVLPAPGYARFWPSPALAPYVEHYWTVSWDLATPETHEVLPHPAVHLVLDRAGSRLNGVARGRFTTCLAGRGRVLGTKFRPGGFRPFLGAAVCSLTGRSIDPRVVFGAAFEEVELRALAEPDAADGFRWVDAFLASHPALAAPLDPRVNTVGQLTERAAQDRDITRVEQLASLFGQSPRGLQRLFAEFVGVSPKWVIQRYRLHEAAERIAHGEVADWAGLALELGYADQAHFIRDFRRWVGKTPADYARAFVP